MTRVKILNPWDVQSKHIHQIDGISSALYSGECRCGGGEIYIMIPKKHNNIQFIAAFEGNGTRPSHQGFGVSMDDISYTLNATERHGVIYELSKDNGNINGK